VVPAFEATTRAITPWLPVTTGLRFAHALHRRHRPAHPLATWFHRPHRRRPNSLAPGHCRRGAHL